MRAALFVFVFTLWLCVLVLCGSSVFELVATTCWGLVWFGGWFTLWVFWLLDGFGFV